MTTTSADCISNPSSLPLTPSPSSLLPSPSSLPFFLLLTVRYGLLELQGIVDCCVSIDSDLFALGSKRLVFVKSWAKDGECWVLVREVILLKVAEAYGVPRLLTDDDFRCLALLSGNDYLTNAYGIQTLKSGKFLEFLNDPAKILSEIKYSLPVQIFARKRHAKI